MSKEDDLLQRWHQEQSEYLAWGRHVVDQVSESLTHAATPVKVGSLLRLPSHPRLKEDRTLIEKAFYRNKTYADPYRDITDKVGVRFVVLLGSEVASVVGALERIDSWQRSKDRDYEEEQNKNPIVFDYAAVHFVVRPQADLETRGVRVTAGTPCEVQIKTLLQHTWSELTHDTIYKPQIQTTASMKRDAAKAMALLEATNDYFEKVNVQVNAALSAVREITSSLGRVYQATMGIEPRPTQIEGMLLEAYEQGLPPDYEDQVSRLLSEKPFLIEQIRHRAANQNPIFTQPSVLLVYLDIADRGSRALSKWPLTPSEMEPLLNDLGESAN